MELIDKIKAAIEKRIALMKELVEREGTCDFALGSIDALQGLLDTVISPIFDEEVREHIDLEEAARKYQESVPVDTTIHYCGADEDVYFANRIVDAVIAGAKWQAEQLLKSSPLPEDTVLFNKGVAEGKRLMMEEAVEGEAHPEDCEIWVNLVGYGYKFNDGDKVKIIIVKKD